MICDSNINEAIFVGIDPSLTGTGIIVLDQDDCIMFQKLVTTDPKDPIEKRLIEILENISFIPNIVRLQKVYMEGPAFASQGNAVLQMGAIHFLIRIFLYKHGVNFKIIAPPTLKKFHTGHGQTKKPEILKKVEETLGVKFKNHNIADAYGLARMALEEYKDGQE